MVQGSTNIIFLYNPSYETIADWVTPNFLAILWLTSLKDQLHLLPEDYLHKIIYPVNFIRMVMGLTENTASNTSRNMNELPNEGTT